MVRRTFLLIFHAGWRRLGSDNFRNSSYKEERSVLTRVSRLSFRYDPFSTNVPLTDKPGSWFLLAKLLKNTCGRVTFQVKMQVNKVHLYLECHCKQY